jgi:hypothetical protein
VTLVNGMDELTIAHVDTDVAETTPVGIGEYQHIAWQQVFSADTLATGQLAGLIVRQ